MGQQKLTRTLKRGRSSVSINQETKKTILHGGVSFSLDNPCMCNLCGQRLGILTHYHAEQHGYQDKFELIEKGHITWRRNPPNDENFTEISKIAADYRERMKIAP